MSESVELSVSHQIRIDGMECWVKAAVVLERVSTELLSTTWDRASDILSDNIISEIEKQAAIILEANKNQRKG